jgi:hypothetical protein
MKKYLILFIICFQIFTLNAQIKKENQNNDGSLLNILNTVLEGLNKGTNDKNTSTNTNQNNSNSQVGGWSSWIQNECYNGMYLRIKKEKYYRGKWTLIIQVKSTYPKKMNYYHNIYSDDIQNGEHNLGRMYVDANYTPSNDRFVILSNDSKITIEILDVCFGEKDDCTTVSKEKCTMELAVP